MSETAGSRGKFPVMNVTFSASGAVEAARSGQLVVIVDAIDMSTTAEVSLAAGAKAVIGATPLGINPPVSVDPYARGIEAGKIAGPGGKIIVFSEPRGAGRAADRRAAAGPVIGGAESTGAVIEAIYSNSGFMVAEGRDLTDRVIVIVSHAGGLTYDAAITAGAVEVMTATIVRGYGRRGWEAAAVGVDRAIERATSLSTGITYVAASANAPEDVLAAFELAKMTIGRGFLDYSR